MFIVLTFVAIVLLIVLILLLLLGPTEQRDMPQRVWWRVLTVKTQSEDQVQICVEQEGSGKTRNCLLSPKESVVFPFPIIRSWKTLRNIGRLEVRFHGDKSPQWKVIFPRKSDFHASNTRQLNRFIFCDNQEGELFVLDRVPD